MTKTLLTLRIEVELIERLRNAVRYLGHGLKLRPVIEEQVAKAVRRLEKQNGGKPFPTRSTPMPRAPQRRRESADNE